MSTITIGNQTRSVMARALAPLAVVTVLAVLAGVLFSQATRYRVPLVRMPTPRAHIDDAGRLEMVLGNSRLYYAGTLPILAGDGEPEASGSLEGLIADDPLDVRTRALAELVAASPLARTGLRWLGEATSTRWVLRNLDEQLTDRERLALAAIASTVGRRTMRANDAIYRDLIRGQFALDHGVVPAASPQAPSKWLARSLTALKKTNSSALLATQLAYPGLPDGGQAWRPLVRLTTPVDGYPYAEVSTPGVLGGVAGANREGLFAVLHVARIHAAALDAGRPSTTLLREVLQNAGSLDDAWRIVSGVKGMAAFVLIVYDARAQRLGLFERAGGRSEWVKRAEGPVFGDGLIGALRDDSANDRGLRMFPVAARQQRMAALLAEPIEDARGLAQRLSDRMDADKQVLPAGHRAAVYDPEAWVSLIFDPGSMVLWIAEDASRHRWQGVAIPQARQLVATAAAPTTASLLAQAFELPAVSEAHSVRLALDATRRAGALFASDPSSARLIADQALQLAPKVPVVIQTCLAIADRAQAAVAEALLARWELSHPDNLDALAQLRALAAHP